MTDRTVSTDPYLVVDRVTHEFELGQERLPVLSDVSLGLHRGEFGALIGPSGSGKSTLLRLVADILQPTSGRITLGGEPPRTARVNYRIGFVFQEATLLPWRTALENVRLPLTIARRNEDAALGTPEELLKLVGLEGFENARPRQLSGGMRQRVAIARALMLKPEFLLLDEPFGALDEITRQQMNFELLRIWRESQTTALFVTHSISESILLSDRVFVLSARPGRVIKEFPIDLPRPRTLRMMSDDRFYELQERLRAALFGAGPSTTAVRS
jgi:NitT/TauT family transport system ATP-binding protein